MLRDYQIRCVNEIRDILYAQNKKSGVLQLATGGGKTAIISEIVKSVFNNQKRAWFIVPRNELLIQASTHFAKWGVPHNLIDAGHKESRAFLIHIVSKDTLLRRLDTVKCFPDLLVFDEAHVALDAQIKIAERLPETSKIIGVTATPERLDGRGLSELYEGICYGPSIPYLTEAGFLAPLRYFAPPIDGLEKLNWRKGEVDADELDELLKKRSVYGKCVEYYIRHGKREDGSRLPALGFCRSIKASEDTAVLFRDAGINFEHIDGAMQGSKQRALIGGLKDGRLDGLTCADLLTYGFDAPCVSYGFSLRPTLSRALYFQMVGRILRPYEGKTEALFFDHVNMIRTHYDKTRRGVPLFYLEDIEWAFNGRDKNKGKPEIDNESNLRVCPYIDYQYCVKKTCVGCLYKKADEPKQGDLIVDVPLNEIKAPLRMRAMLPEERREIQDAIAKAISEARYGLTQGKIIRGPIAELVGIAEQLHYHIMWVYWQLTDESRRTVNVPLLHEIARIKGYKPKWAQYQAERIRESRTAG
jgi:superfamily II DNA or RNA helicase